MNYRFKVLAVVLPSLMSSPVFAQPITLPERNTPRPETTNNVPHIQIGVQVNQKIYTELLKRVEKLPGVKLGQTRVSLPGAIGFQLEKDMPLARPDVIVGGREFAHIHPDGSLHASLDPAIAIQAIESGWAVAHPWSQLRDGWEGFVMIYTPLSSIELEVVYDLIESSYSYVTGNQLL